MLADFYIPWRSNDMKIAVQKNHLGVKFSTEVKKRRLSIFYLLSSYLAVILYICVG